MSKVGRMADADMSTMTVQSWVEVSCITIHSPVYFGFPITSIFFGSNTVPILALNLGLSMCTLAFKTAIYPLLPSPIAVHCCVRWHTALDVNRFKEKKRRRRDIPDRSFKLEPVLSACASLRAYCCKSRSHSIVLTVSFNQQQE